MRLAALSTQSTAPERRCRVCVGSVFACRLVVCAVGFFCFVCFRFACCVCGLCSGRSESQKSVVAHPTLPLVITAHESKHLKFVDLNSGKVVHSMIAHPDAVSSVAMDPAGLYICSGGTCCVSVASVVRLQLRFTSSGTIFVDICVFVLCTGHDGSIRFWDIGRRVLVQELPVRISTLSLISSLFCLGLSCLWRFCHTAPVVGASPQVRRGRAGRSLPPDKDLCASAGADSIIKLYQ